MRKRADMEDVWSALGCSVAGLAEAHVLADDIEDGVWVAAVSNDRIAVGRAQRDGGRIIVSRVSFTDEDQFHRVAPSVHEYTPSLVYRILYRERAYRTEVAPTLREAIQMFTPAESVTEELAGERIVIESDYEARLVTVTDVTRSSFADDLVVSYMDGEDVRQTTFPDGVRVMREGRYTDADRVRAAEIEAEYRRIYAEEIRNAVRRSRLRP